MCEEVIDWKERATDVLLSQRKRRRCCFQPLACQGWCKIGKQNNSTAKFQFNLKFFLIIITASHPPTQNKDKKTPVMLAIQNAPQEHKKEKVKGTAFHFTLDIDFFQNLTPNRNIFHPYHVLQSYTHFRLHFLEVVLDQPTSHKHRPSAHFKVKAKVGLKILNTCHLISLLWNCDLEHENKKSLAVLLRNFCPDHCAKKR